MGMTVFSQSAITVPNPPKYTEVKKMDFSDKSPVERKLLEISLGHGDVEDILKFTTVEEAPLGSHELGSAIRDYITTKSDSAKNIILNIIEDSESEDPTNEVVQHPLAKADDDTNPEGISKSGEGELSKGKKEGKVLEGTDSKPKDEGENKMKNFSEVLADSYEKKGKLSEDEMFAEAVDSLKKLTFPQLRKELKEVEYQFSEEVSHGVSELLKGRMNVEEFSELLDDDFYPRKTHIDFEYPKNVVLSLFSGMSQDEFNLAKKYPETKNSQDILTLDNEILNKKFSSISFADIFEEFADAEKPEDLKNILDFFPGKEDAKEVEFSEGLVYLESSTGKVKVVGNIEDNVDVTEFASIQDYLKDENAVQSAVEFSEIEEFFNGEEDYKVLREPFESSSKEESTFPPMAPRTPDVITWKDIINQELEEEGPRGPFKKEFEKGCKDGKLNKPYDAAYKFRKPQGSLNAPMWSYFRGYVQNHPKHFVSPKDCNAIVFKDITFSEESSNLVKERYAQMFSEIAEEEGVEFSYTENAKPVDQVKSNTDLLKGEMAFQKSLNPKNALNDDQKAYMTILVAYVKDNPAYVPQLLNDSQLQMLRELTDKLRTKSI